MNTKKFIAVVLTVAALLTFAACGTPVIEEKPAPVVEDVAEPAVLSAPVKVKAASAGTDSVKISWNKVDAASKYIVYMSENNSDFTEVGTAKSGDTSFTVTGLTSGRKYYFKVRAYNKQTDEYSEYSGEAYAKPFPAKVSGVKVKSTDAGLKISWGNVSGASGYAVYRSASKNGVYERIGESSVTNYTCNELTESGEYYYRIRAFVTAGGTDTYGAYSEVAFASYKTDGTDIPEPEVPESGEDAAGAEELPDGGNEVEDPYTDKDDDNTGSSETPAPVPTPTPKPTPTPTPKPTPTPVPTAPVSNTPTNPTNPTLTNPVSNPPCSHSHTRTETSVVSEWEEKTCISPDTLGRREDWSVCYCCGCGTEYKGGDCPNGCSAAYYVKHYSRQYYTTAKYQHTQYQSVQTSVYCADCGKLISQNTSTVTVGSYTTGGEEVSHTSSS